MSPWCCPTLPWHTPCLSGLQTQSICGWESLQALNSSSDIKIQNKNKVQNTICAKDSLHIISSITLSINLPFSRVFPVDRRIGDLSSLLHVVLQILQKMCQEPQQQTLFAIQTNLAVVHFCHILIS